LMEPNNISDYDTYQLSKYFPGSYSPHSVYAPSGQLCKAVTVKNGFSLDQ